MTTSGDPRSGSRRAHGDPARVADMVAEREALRDLRISDLHARCALFRARIRRLEDAIVAEEVSCIRDVAALWRRARR